MVVRMMMVMVLVLMMVLVLVLLLLLVLVLVQDNTKGLPLIDDVVAFSMRSVRNMMKILLCIYKN